MVLCVSAINGGNGQESSDGSEQRWREKNCPEKYDTELC